jgi:hypothetical protein
LSFYFPSEFYQPAAAWSGLSPTSWLLSWGFCLYSTYQLGESTIPERCHPSVRSAFKVFHLLDGFLLPEPTQPFFMPEALMRFSLRGFSPLTSRTPLGVLTPLPLNSVAQPETEAQGRYTLNSRLRSFSPVKDPYPYIRFYPIGGPIPPWDFAPLKLSPLRPRPFRANPFTFWLFQHAENARSHEALSTARLAFPFF